MASGLSPDQRIMELVRTGNIFQAGQEAMNIGLGFGTTGIGRLGKPAIDIAARSARTIEGLQELDGLLMKFPELNKLLVSSSKLKRYPELAKALETIGSRELSAMGKLKGKEGIYKLFIVLGLMEVHNIAVQQAGEGLEGYSIAAKELAEAVAFNDMPADQALKMIESRPEFIDTTLDIVTKSGMLNPLSLLFGTTFAAQAKLSGSKAAIEAAETQIRTRQGKPEQPSQYDEGLDYMRGITAGKKEAAELNTASREELLRTIEEAQLMGIQDQNKFMAKYPSLKTAGESIENRRDTLLQLQAKRAAEELKKREDEAAGFGVIETEAGKTQQVPAIPQEPEKKKKKSKLEELATKNPFGG